MDNSEPPSQTCSTETLLKGLDPAPVVLITMGGQGFRFKEAGYTEPKPFVKVIHKTMIENVLQMFPCEWPVVFVLNSTDYTSKHVEFLKKLRPQSSQLAWVDANTGGPWQTVMNGLELIKDQQPVFVTYCDYSHEWNAKEFLNFVKCNQADAAFVSYKGFHPHYLGPNMYCYTQTDGEKVLDIKEKESFSTNRESDYASTGGYFFKSKKLLLQALLEQKNQNLSWNGEYFTSLAIKALMNVRADLKVLNYEIFKFYQWGTPQDLKAFQYWNDVQFNKF